MRFKPDGLTPNAWAVAAGVSRTVWADMKRHGNPSRRTLERLLATAGSSLAEFEALRIGGAPPPSAGAASALSDRHAGDWRPAQLPPLPLLMTTLAGEWGRPGRGIELIGLHAGEIIDRLARPASLAGDAGAYAMTIVGESMRPRFRAGRRIAISPKAPVSTGDDLLVKLNSGAAIERDPRATPVLIKELVRMGSNAVALRQFNPPLDFEVPRSDIEAIEKVVGELI